MKLDHQYLKTLYENNTIEDFIRLVSEDDIESPHMKAIISTMRRSIKNLHLEFNPLYESNIENSQESK